MKRYSVCKLSATTRLLCSECIGDPFRVEELRTHLAEKMKPNDLKKTYLKRFAEIKNINTPEFWDRLLEKNRVKEKNSPIVRDRIKITLRMIEKLRGRLLDVGFGHGFIEEFLSIENAFDLCGIDISSKAVNRLKRTINGDFKIGSILDIPFTDKFFDVVLALEILEHIPPHNTFKAINELRRVLKVGGTLIFRCHLMKVLKKCIEKELIRVATLECTRLN